MVGIPGGGRPLRAGRTRCPRVPAPEPASPPAAPALDSAAAGDLTDALCEFDAVLADFASPFHERHFHYEEHLERMKRRSSASVSDSSGFSDSESKCAPRLPHRPRRSAGRVSVCPSVVRGVGPCSSGQSPGPRESGVAGRSPSGGENPGKALEGQWVALPPAGVTGRRVY